MSKSRNWSLRKLTKDNGSDQNDQDDDEYEEFMKEIEGDREYRSRINLYKKDTGGVDGSKGKKGENDAEGKRGNRSRIGDGMISNTSVIDHEDVSVNMNGGMDDEEVRLDELLDDMSLGDDNDGDDDYNDEEDHAGVDLSNCHNHDDNLDDL